MKPFIVFSLAWSLSCFPASPEAFAAPSNPVSVAATDGGFSMPRAQVRRLGVDKFMEVYSKGHGSTVGEMQGYDYYTRSRRADNDQSARVLSARHRQQIGAVRDALSQLGDAAWAMTEIENGGGSMWRVAASSVYATREDALAKLISALKQPRHSAAARLQRRTLFAKMRKQLAQLQTRRVESYDAPYAADAQRNFNASWKKAQTASTQLQQLVAHLPDNAAQQVAQRAFDELNNPLKDSAQDQ